MSNTPVTLDPGEELRVPKNWKLVSKSGDMAIVADGPRTGRTPIKNHGIDFECARCGNYGPWKGVTCLACDNLMEL